MISSINDISDALFDHLDSKHKMPIEKIKVMITQYDTMLRDKSNKIDELDRDYIEKYESKRIMQDQMYEQFKQDRQELYDDWLANGSRKTLYDMLNMHFDYKPVPDIYVRADRIHKTAPPKPEQPAKKKIVKPKAKQQPIEAKPQPKEPEKPEKPATKTIQIDEPKQDVTEPEKPHKPDTKPATKPAKTLGHCGLQNFGNSCYINATLQYLLHLDIFNDIILEHRGSDNPVVEAYINLYDAYTQKRVDANILHSLVDKLNDTLAEDDKFDVTTQSDASEFMLKLFEKMNLKELTNIFEIKIETKKEIDKTIQKGKKELRCDEIKDVLSTSESSLILVFKDKKQIYNIGSELTKSYDGIVEEVGKKADYINCDKTVDIATEKVLPKAEKFPYTRTDKVTTFPYVLRIICNIFDHKGHKLFNKTEIPNEWEYDGHKYKLNGIIVHIGATKEAGHYEYYSAETDNWYEYSDTDVHIYKAMKPKAAYYALNKQGANIFYPNKTLPTPYVLSYVKV
jgi:ubiquitin C-terminal hydrolase